MLSARLTYAFTPRMFASAFPQYDSAGHTLSNNLRFRWGYQPGSELFVVYTGERDTTRSGLPALANRTFTVEITRLFRF